MNDENEKYSRKRRRRTMYYLIEVQDESMLIVQNKKNLNNILINLFKKYTYKGKQLIWLKIIIYEIFDLGWKKMMMKVVVVKKMKKKMKKKMTNYVIMMTDLDLYLQKYI